MNKTMVILALALMAGVASQVSAQGSGSVAGSQATANVHVMSHIPGRLTDIEVEQELSRPYAYVPIRVKDAGYYIIDMHDVYHSKVDRKSVV